MRATTAGSWRRSRGTTARSGSGRRGGFTIRWRGCAASARRRPKRRASGTPPASTTTPAPSVRFPRGTTSPVAWTPTISRGWWHVTSWAKPMRTASRAPWRTIWHGTATAWTPLRHDASNWMQPMMPPKGRAYLAVLVPLLLLDRATKVIAVAQLVVATPQPVIGNTLRFTLVYNRNAAMDITLGPWSRWGFAAIAVVGVIVMLRWLRAARPGD